MHELVLRKREPTLYDNEMIMCAALQIGISPGRLVAEPFISTEKVRGSRFESQGILCWLQFSRVA